MDLRLEPPTTQHHYEHWAAIMERVSGDALNVEELAHVFETDRESAWLLALRGEEPLGCGVGRPSSIAGSLLGRGPLRDVAPPREGHGHGD